MGGGRNQGRGGAELETHMKATTHSISDDMRQYTLSNLYRHIKDSNMGHGMRMRTSQAEAGRRALRTSLHKAKQYSGTPRWIDKGSQLSASSAGSADELLDIAPVPAGQGKEA